MNRFVMIACLLGLGALPSLTHSQELIAHYPLASDALDATGHYDPMTLVNAPFEQGGVYCNGIYTNEPGGYLVQTPQLTALDFSSVAISASFKLTPDHSATHPIFIAGLAYRWIGVEVSAARELVFRYNNNLSMGTGVTLTPDVWYWAFVAYDGTTSTGSLYLNGAPVLSETFVLDHGTDRDVSTTHFGEGLSFKGHFKDLRVYDSAFVPTPVERSTWGEVKSVFASGAR